MTNVGTHPVAMLKMTDSETSHGAGQGLKMTKKNIVVIDDDREMRELLKDFFSARGFSVPDFPTARDALARFESPAAELDSIELIISDINMPGLTGLEFAERMKRIAPQIPIILITAFGSIETAIEAIRKGAYDYVVKPFKLEELSVTVDRTLEFRQLQKENKVLRDEIKQTHSFAGILGKSGSMQEVFDLIKRVAPANANILISGESGTGKERVARAIHDLGPRAKKPFVAINCTAIPDTLLESELFGHAKGSFTGAIQKKRGLFEEAEGGTIFLDEIGDMDLALQSKLLRVIQEKKVRSVGDNVDRPIDVRILAATHKDLKAAIKNGTFREDLYYRLSVIPIVIPPLRLRKEDVPLLAEFFLNKYAAENGSRVSGFTPQAMAKLLTLSWEGNVRELENLVERCVVLAKGEQIDVADIPTASQSEQGDSVYASAVEQTVTLEELEKRYMRYIMEKTGGKKEKAAQILGISRRTLYRKEREFGWVTDEDSQEDQDE
jgi:two-component system, NtrC family, response regulator HydG